MKHLKFLSLIMMMLFIITACHKETVTVVVPEACMTLSADILHVNDSLTVYNCSKADNTFITFTDSTNANPDSCKCVMTGYSFDEDNKITHVFSLAGTNYVYLRVSNNQNGSPLKSKLMSVTILP